jgi:hypothetical protein
MLMELQLAHQTLRVENVQKFLCHAPRPIFYSLSRGDIGASGDRQESRIVECQLFYFGSDLP